MTACVVIPARYGSTRFPAKILASETGRPMVQHVVDQARRAKSVREVIVATDDQRIIDALSPFGTRCVMTSNAHQSGTDRIAEAAQKLDDSVIVNVQGDEPEIEPEIIDALIERLASSGEDMATAATRFPRNQSPADPNLVKVVLSHDHKALYFSRAPIPFRRDPDDPTGPHDPYLLHLGIYAYRRKFLIDFASWDQTPLEKTEKLEQLRALEHGHNIAVLIVERAAHGIDTAEQYAAFVRRWKTSLHR